jgi:hypothetical protein
LQTHGEGPPSDGHRPRGGHAMASGRPPATETARTDRGSPARPRPRWTCNLTVRSVGARSLADGLRSCRLARQAPGHDSSTQQGQWRWRCRRSMAGAGRPTVDSSWIPGAPILGRRSPSRPDASGSRFAPGPAAGPRRTLLRRPRAAQRTGNRRDRCR